jgi:CheY-like chemotaxis protein
MSIKIHDLPVINPVAGTEDGITELNRQKTLLKADALQATIFNSANFSSIATDANGVIQIFNLGAERMLGYAATNVINKITPTDISEPYELVARAKALSSELSTPIAPGFDALVFKASRGIENIYELTYIRKDGRRFPAVVSVTALRDDQNAIIGSLLIGTDNTARKQGTVEVQCTEREPGRLRTTIKESGAGLDSEQLAQLFQAFNRLEQEGSDVEGTGIGLVAAKQLVELMGGKMGVGSVFWFELLPTAAPNLSLETGDTGATTRSAAPLMNFLEVAEMAVEHTLPELRAVHQNQLILVAEDNKSNRLLLQQQLEFLGFSAEIAVDGREALERWKTGAYALLLTDMNMTGMNGYELTAAIRSIEAKAGTGRTPVIALTGNAMKGEDEHCKSVGMDDYLSKPLMLSDLKAMLAKWLPVEARVLKE